jgi:hypothetical protein
MSYRLSKRTFMPTLVLTVLLAAVPCEAATYYVDASSGNDANPGTSTSPWKTLGRAKITSTASPRVAYGDTVILRNGRYGGFNLPASALTVWSGELHDPLPDGQQWVTYKAEAGHTDVYFSNISFDFGSTLHILAHAFDGIKIVDPGGRCVYGKGVMGIKLKNMTLIGELDPDALATAKATNIDFLSRNNVVEIDNCEIQGGYRGICVDGYTGNVRITNNNIHNIGVDKIMFGGGRNIVIENNRLHSNALLPTEHPDCIQFYTASDRYETASATNVTIRGNWMYDHSSQGVWTGGSILKNVVFENNLMYNLGNYEWRVYGVHTGVIRNNTIIGERNRITGIIVYGGTFTESSGLLNGVPRNKDITVVNNIFACPYWGDPGVMTYHDHNLFYESGDSPGNSELNSYKYTSMEAIIADVFANPSANDFRPRDGSRAINFGTTATGIYPTDIAGTPRQSAPDAGCFEAGGTTGNQAPVLAPIGNQQVAAGATLTLTISATDADGDALTYSASGLPSGASFSGDTLTWTPTEAQAGNHQVAFTVTDGQLYDSEAIVITVAGTGTDTNNAPNLTDIGNKSVNENEPLSFSISASDSDNDSITYSASGLPSGATFSGQDFNWTPTFDQAGSYQVTFTASDGQDQDSETITITVANVNRAPVMSDLGDQSVDESNTLAFSVSANDPDGDAITYSATGLPSGATFTDSSFSWTPTTDQVGTYDLTIIASDGHLQASDTITLYVVAAGADGTAPTVARMNPEPDAIQVIRNNLVTLHVTDAGKGVKSDSVVIRLDNEIIYQGNVDIYTSATGQCTRSGTWNDYRFIYQPDNPYAFDHTATVAVDASDLAGNTMSTYTYSFMTEMRAFGSNWIVSDNSPTTGQKNRPATVSNATGDIWTVWHAGATGARDIYAASLASGTSAFRIPVPVTTDPTDQCNPDVALSEDGQLYAVWQDNRRGNWDIFLSTSSDGATWTHPVQLTTSDGNETNPAIAIDGQSPYRVCVVWQDDRDGNADIYAACSTNAFTDSTVSRVTTDVADQIDPDVAVDGAGVACIVWTDLRSGQADIYGAALTDSVSANVPIVTTISTQNSPAIAADPSTSALHIAWVDHAPGDADIYYVKSDGLPASPLTGTTIIDDTSGANQFAPAIVCINDANVFACWQDLRSSDTDLFMTELGSGAAKTNVLVGDNSTNTGQSEPAIGVDGYEQPYVVWTDSRDAQTEIYYAGTTFISPNPLDSKHVVAVEGATIGTDPALIDEPSDVSIIVPPGACQCDVRITISEILNPVATPAECLGSYDFGPSGIDFDQPVTVTIPYRFNGDGSSAKPYWYDSLTGAMSQIGITDIQNIVIASDLNALQFKTTHFTPFYLMADTSTSDDGGAVAGFSSDSPGGCSVSATGTGSPKELLVPYGLIAIAMIALRRRDRKRRQSFRTAGG